MWSVSGVMLPWLLSKKKFYEHRDSAGPMKPCLLSNLNEKTRPLQKFANQLRSTKKYAPNKMMVLQFGDKSDMEGAKDQLSEQGITAQYLMIKYRSISRDIPGAYQCPRSIRDRRKNTLCMTLIAPIAFTEAALEKKGCRPKNTRNIGVTRRRASTSSGSRQRFLRTHAAAMWLGSQSDTGRLPIEGELQLNEVFGCFHLRADGMKMSKSRGNFYTGPVAR